MDTENGKVLKVLGLLSALSGLPPDIVAEIFQNTNDSIEMLTRLANAGRALRGSTGTPDILWTRLYLLGEVSAEEMVEAQAKKIAQSDWLLLALQDWTDEQKQSVLLELEKHGWSPKIREQLLEE